MSFTFGTLSMLILLSLLCLNYSSICKGVYHRSIELTAPYDVDIFDYEQPFDDFNEYLRVIDEDYTINESIEFNIYKDPAHQIQNYYDVQFYNFDPVMKLSDYNKLLKMRSLNSDRAKKATNISLSPTASCYIKWKVTTRSKISGSQIKSCI